MLVANDLILADCACVMAIRLAMTSVSPAAEAAMTKWASPPADIAGLAVDDGAGDDCAHSAPENATAPASDHSIALLLKPFMIRISAYESGFDASSGFVTRVSA
ncbi:hypothetical protein GCM10010872_34060 [Dyella flava]|nr:hypothetical protein GCM10010872_34060 [Dyella flava]